MSKVKSGHHKRFSVNIPNMEQNRLQGWLTVANAVETDHLDQLEWQKRYCVLAKDDRKLYFFNDTESVLSASPLSPVRFNYHENQDGASMSSQRKNALTLLDPSYSNFQRGTRQTRSFRDRVRNTISKSVKRSTKGADNLLPPVPTGGGSVRVGRSRSFGKVDKIDQTLTLPVVTSKLGHSLENLYRVGSHGTTENRSVSLGEHGTFLDLAMRGGLSILPIHGSISPRHSCFRIITDSDILYASCGSQEELEKWITNLLNCQRPNKNHLRRLDTQLSVWVLEARNLQPKKGYFCEVYLNSILYAQTCCKVMNDILFWGEPFVFNDLPPLGSIAVKVFKENFNKKKREKVPATDMGKVEVPSLVLEGGQLLEKWYPLTVYSTGKGSYGANKDKERENTSLRLKLQYQVVSILPLKTYDEFLKYLESNYGVVCDVFEPSISVRAKDDIAQTLVRILQELGKVKDFLCDIIMAEVEHTENENLIFRGNTFATKAVDTYMKMVGEEYLRQALSPFILALLESEDDCEVDPLKMAANANLQYNQAALVQLARRAWLDILSSVTKFPSDLRGALNAIRQRFGPQREDACFKLISGSIFLRFLCPAILSPSLFRLCQEYPDEKTARKLTLVAKVLQNLANFARFGVKEEYMCFMNDFVETEIKNMKEFLNKISAPVSETDPLVSWHARRIDLGREASIMHTTLTSQLKTVKLSEDKLRRLDPLVAMLVQLSKAQEDDQEDPFSSTFEALRVMQSTISTFSADRENSESSSEYTTPAQSQPTSPGHEQSPPPLGVADTARSILGSAAQVLSQTPPTDLPLHRCSSSPNTSPTHSGVISRLATHSHTSQDLRRLSDTELTPQKGSNNGSRKTSDQPRGSLKLDEHSELIELRTENTYLRGEIVSLKKQLSQQHEENEKENDRLRRLEEERRRSENELKILKDSRGKILRGLNTQTEIALIQFKRDFEHLRKQLEAKDEIITVQERRIASLIESNSTLRSGLQELNSIPKHEDSDSDDLGDEVRARMAELERTEKLVNGHGMSTATGPGREQSSLNPDLQQVISQLEDGKFDL